MDFQNAMEPSREAVAKRWPSGIHAMPQTSFSCPRLQPIRTSLNVESLNRNWLIKPWLAPAINPLALFDQDNA